MAYNGILSFGIAGLCALGVMGCAQFSRDGGFDEVARASRLQIGTEVRWARTPEERAKSDLQIADLLQHPLSVNDAVQIALLGNAALQASFQELGISEADLVQSGRLPNPGFTLRHAASGGVYDIEETLSVNVISLLSAPSRHRIQQRRFQETQHAVTLEIARLAARTRDLVESPVAGELRAAHDA